MKETAFRSGEVLHLTPEDIDFEKGIIIL
jgi:integrase